MKFLILHVIFLFMLADCAPHFSFSDKGRMTIECTVEKNGELLFIGDQKCLGRLQKRVLTGYWVVDHEYSVFYRELPSPIPTFDDTGTWLELRPEAVQSLATFSDRSQRRIYRVSFQGFISNRKGLYGNGLFSSGALVERFIEVQLVS